MRRAFHLSATVPLAAAEHLLYGGQYPVGPAGRDDRCRHAVKPSDIQTQEVLPGCPAWACALPTNSMMPGSIVCTAVGEIWQLSTTERQQFSGMLELRVQIGLQRPTSYPELCRYKGLGPRASGGLHPT